MVQVLLAEGGEGAAGRQASVARDAALAAQATAAEKPQGGGTATQVQGPFPHYSTMCTACTAMTPYILHKFGKTSSQDTFVNGGIAQVGRL
jgi:hypothetical protein